MFISNLSLLIKNYEELKIENRILVQELKKLKKTDVIKENKINKKEKICVKKEKTPSLF